MDVNFCRYVVILYVFTGPITCNNPLQTIGDDTRPSKHPIVEENINYLVSNDGGKRKRPPNRHLMAFEARRRLVKRSESSSGDDRSRNRLRSGSLSSDKITDTENNEMVVPYREGLRKHTKKKSKRTEINRKYDEFTKQITGQREDYARNVEVHPELENSKSGSSPATTLDQFYLDLPIYETQIPVHQQEEVVGPDWNYVDEESRDSSQSSDEKIKHEIRPDQSAMGNSVMKTRTEPRKRPRKKVRNSSPVDDSSESDESEYESSSTEDNTKISKDSGKEGASSTLKTHFFTLTTQSVDVTAPPAVFTSSFGKETTLYSTSQQSFKTVKEEITKEILSHRRTATNVSGVTSSPLVTTVSDFPTPRPDSGNGMSTKVEFTTRAFLVTKFPQTEAKRPTTTTIRTPRPLPRDPVTIGPVQDFITNQGSIPITIAGVACASIIAVVMVATSSFIGSRRSLPRGRSPSLATLPESIELHDA